MKCKVRISLIVFAHKEFNTGKKIRAKASLSEHAHPWNPILSHQC